MRYRLRRRRRGGLRSCRAPSPRALPRCCALSAVAACGGAAMRRTTRRPCRAAGLSGQGGSPPRSVAAAAAATAARARPAARATARARARTRMRTRVAAAARARTRAVRVVEWRRCRCSVRTWARC
eukprot:scaffold48914_cov58-Phaeocystis_antarctica.AAC.1